MRSPRACVSDVRCGAAQPVAASCSHLCYLLCPDGVSSLCRSLRAAEWIAWPKVRRSFDLPSTWILVEDTSPIWKLRTLRKKQSASPGAPSLPIGGHGETTFADLEKAPRELQHSQPPLPRPHAAGAHAPRPAWEMEASESSLGGPTRQSTRVSMPPNPQRLRRSVSVLAISAHQDEAAG